MRKAMTILSHIVFVLSITYIVLWIFDYYNPLMELMTNVVTGKVLLGLFLCGLALSIVCMRISVEGQTAEK